MQEDKNKHITLNKIRADFRMDFLRFLVEHKLSGNVRVSKREYVKLGCA